MRLTSILCIALFCGACSKNATQTAQQQASTTQPDPNPPPPATETYNIPSGLPIRVRIDQTLATSRNRAGDRFTASLYGPLLIDGREAIPNGTVFSGHVTQSNRSGHFKGRAIIGLALDSFTLDGEVYPIGTASDHAVGRGHKKHNFLFIGTGAGTGAAVGAMAGGGVGAGIGAGVGASMGLTTALFTGKKDVAVRAESILSFRLTQDVPITVTETATVQ
jgi:hypothetical protein